MRLTVNLIMRVFGHYEPLETPNLIMIVSLMIRCIMRLLAFQLSTRYSSKEDYRRAAKAHREAIALKPDRPVPYFNLANALCKSGHYVEAAQRCLEATERLPLGSANWAEAAALAFNMLTMEECCEVTKPEWWNDEGLKGLSARIVRAAPNNIAADCMRAEVLSGQERAWEAGPRSAAELKEAAVHFDRAAALCRAPAQKAGFTHDAGWCRNQAAAM
eukprot:scaffold103101_cov57-Phaeocystis_antarctica.AAC.2